MRCKALNLGIQSNLKLTTACLKKKFIIFRFDENKRSFLSYDIHGNFYTLIIRRVAAF